MRDSQSKYVGVDWSKAGWLSIGIDDSRHCGTKLIAEFSDLLHYYANASLILVDIPIGLFDEQQAKRECDTQARKYLTSMGGQSGSVFPAPNRKLAQEALQGRVNWKDSKIVHTDTGNPVKLCWGKGVNSQTLGITRATAEVDAVMSTPIPDRARNVRESHPEVCFRKLKHGCVTSKKKDPTGECQRLNILLRYEKQSKRILEDTFIKFGWKSVARDDILDALVLTVTARLFCNYPDRRGRFSAATKDSKNLPMEMVYVEGTPTTP